MKVRLLLLLLCSALLLPSLFSHAQTPPRGQGVRIRVENNQEIDLYSASYALVIGVSRYTNGWSDLPGVKADMPAVKAALEQHGFQVETLLDPQREAVDRVVRRFISRYGQAERHRLVIYFAGHGHTLKTGDGRDLGYIVPADAPDPRRDQSGFIENAVSMTEIENYAQQMQARHALFVFDSCFSGSLFEANRALPPIISAKTAQSVRQFITAGTAEQEVPDRSIFREQFVEALRGEADYDRDGFVTGSELGMFLENKVANYSKGAQTPRWGKIRNARLDRGDLVFALNPTAPPPTVNAADRCALAWDAIKTSENEATLQSFIAECKGTAQGFAANLRLDDLRAGRRTAATNPPASNPGPAALTPVIALPRGVPVSVLRRATFTTTKVDAKGRVTRTQAGPVQSYEVDLGGVKLEMVAVPGGRFQMGSPASEHDRNSDETQHWVRVSDFWVGRYEVTQGQWKAVMGSLPPNMADLSSDFKGDNLPVVRVSWEESKQFCEKLDAKLSLSQGSHRLPYEAEWEFAARAGQPTAFAFGPTITPEVVNYASSYPYGGAARGRYLGHPTAGGSLGAANLFGLFDMHGNVREWCEDWYGDYPSNEVTDPRGAGSGSYRVFRGGGWGNFAVFCRSAFRYYGATGHRDHDLGFRLVRT